MKEITEQPSMTNKELSQMARDAYNKGRHAWYLATNTTAELAVSKLYRVGEIVFNGDPGKKKDRRGAFLTSIRWSRRSSPWGRCSGYGGFLVLWDDGTISTTTKIRTVADQKKVIDNRIMFAAKKAAADEKSRRGDYARQTARDLMNRAREQAEKCSEESIQRRIDAAVKAAVEANDIEWENAAEYKRLDIAAILDKARDEVLDRLDTL